MRLQSAEIENFRNLSKVRLEFAADLTVLVGDNGEGKTNTLEALYLACCLRPLRPVTKKSLIQNAHEQCSVNVRALVAKTGLTHDLDVVLKARGVRKLLKDGKAASSDRYLGTAVAVSFTPDDLDLFKGGPEARRAFLDRALLNVRSSFLSRALRYSKALRERNRALAESASESLLEAYEEILAAEGTFITLRRLEYAQEVQSLVSSNFIRIVGPEPSLSLAYESNVLRSLGVSEPFSTEEETRDRLRQLYHENRRKDLMRKRTTIGTHLDDFSARLDQDLAKNRASQGQHRALVLSLKLAQIEHLNQSLGEPPVLLLDDMSSELDEERSRALFSRIRLLDAQVVLTSTETPRRLAERLGRERLDSYTVRAGCLASSGGSSH